MRGVAAIRSVQELEERLALGHERRDFEVKGPGDVGDKAYAAKVARAVMAMGNLRYGGIVCLGIDNDRISEMQPGLSAAQVAQWTDYDRVTTALARYTDPPVSLHPKPYRLSSQVEVVILEVDEFHDVPHVCRKDYTDELHEGAMYVRPRGMPKSVPVPDASEMRDLLEIATDKALREFLRRAHEAGVHLPGTAAAIDSDLNLFDAERDQAWAANSPVTEHLAALGHSDVAVRPGPYDPQRLDPGMLQPFVEQQTVRLRGWPLPYIDYREPVKRYGTWIGQDIGLSVVPHLEAWRQCVSGQFLHCRALATDLRDDDIFRPLDERATGAVAVWDVLLYMVEVAEFAARVATELRCDHLSFVVGLGNIAGRQLISGSSEDEYGRARLIVYADQLTATRQVDSAALLSNVRGVGVSLAQDLLRQFGLDVPDRVLLQHQERIFGR